MTTRNKSNIPVVNVFFGKYCIHCFRLYSKHLQESAFLKSQAK